MDTLEISPVSITIKEPLKNVIFSEARKLNYGFMLGELAWILQGSNDAHHIAHYNKNWLNYSDDGIILNGAYGQRIFNYGSNNPSEGVNQFEEAFKQLQRDKNSRQATIVLFDPTRDFKETKDKPCTNLIRFSIRENKLNMIVFMRSNDIMFGYPYDVFNFSTLQSIMANKLNLNVGIYTHIVDSFHLYKEQLSWANDIMREEQPIIYGPLEIERKFDSNDIQTFLNVEQTTRKMIGLIDVETIEKMLLDIDSEYWRSNAAFLALYNYRKMHYSQKTLDKFKKLITNELVFILDRYGEL
jgi:thymidylate synthase